MLDHIHWPLGAGLAVNAKHLVLPVYTFFLSEIDN